MYNTRDQKYVSAHIDIVKAKKQPQKNKISQLKLEGW
jgi:hypothetical protein